MRAHQQPLESPRNPSLLAALALVLVFAGCSGGDGATGPAGPQGPPGPPGGGSGTSTELEQGEAPPGVHVAIVSLGGASGGNGAFQVGDFPSIRFTVTKTDGSAWDLSELNYGRVLVSGPTSNYQRVLPEANNVATTAVDNGDGTHTYTFASPIPAVYAAPLNDSAAFDADDGELTGQALLDGTYTLGLYFGWSYTVNEVSFKDVGDTTQDFLFGGATEIDSRAVVAQDNCNACHTSLRAHGDLRRNVGICLLCHTTGAEDRISAAAGGTPGASIDFKVMIHKLHDGSHMPSVLGVRANDDGSLDYATTPAPYLIVGYQDSVHDFSGVKFPVWPNFNIAMPKDANYSTLSSTDPDGSGGPLLSPKSRNDTIRTGVTACAKCHGDPDGAGPLAAPVQGDLHKTHPTEQACYSCHDDVRPGFPYTSNLQTMPATANNSNCTLCHPGSVGSLSVESAHRHPLLDPGLNAGVAVAITDVTGATGGNGNFQVGDTPTLEFTVQNDAGEDIGLSTLDSWTAFFMGPTTNRQLVMPLTSATGLTVNPFDFTGRLQAVSSSNKGTLSKVFLGSTAVAETLTVELTSTTAFSVTGSTSGALGTGTLPGAASTNPTGGALSAFELGASLNTGTFQVTFTDATHFNVTGAASGSGALPNATNASMRFTSANLSFNIAVTSTPFANGNTIHVGLFRGAAANPVLFAIVAGKTAFSATAAAPDRFYYEVVPDAASYSVEIPMDMQLEFLGAGSGAAGQVLTAGNLPVYYGRQQLWEAVTSATSTTTTESTSTLGREVDVAGATGFAAGDTVAVEPSAAVGVREYVTITPLKADGTGAASGDTTTRILFRTPLRYAHAPGVTLTKVTLGLKQEGAGNAYTLTPATGVLTSNVGLNASAGIVLSYRTDARFGYKRHAGDLYQSTHIPPPNDIVAVGQEQGDWQGLPLEEGTYTASMWGYKSLDLGLQGEVQTYRCTSRSASADFLYGSPTELVPHQILSSSATCNACHNDVLFHGGGRRGADTCLTCHSISGTMSSLIPTGSQPVEFRQMLHKIHMGEELPDAATYPFATEGAFPAMPGGPEQCVKCHGNDSWEVPAARECDEASVPVRIWSVSCGSCHSSDAAHAHIDVQTSMSGYESCEVCHGPDKEWNTQKMHTVH